MADRVIDTQSQPGACGLPAPTLPALATAIRGWFPELKGRAFAVSEADVTRENVPELPLVMVALARESAEHSAQSNMPIQISEDVLIQFWLQTDRYRKTDGSESPFWAYYNYEAIRDTFLANTFGWRSPRDGLLQYVSMDIEADQIAVVLTFRMNHIFLWNPNLVIPAAQCGAGWVLTASLGPAEPHHR